MVIGRKLLMLFRKLFLKFEAECKILSRLISGSTCYLNCHLLSGEASGHAGHAPHE